MFSFQNASIPSRIGSITLRHFARGRSGKGKQVFRADRVLSNRGWGSRSECFEVLQRRRVFVEDDQLEEGMRRLLGPSEKIPMDVGLWVDGKREVPKPPPLLQVYNKPKWVLSVMKDDKGRKNLGELDFVDKLHPVGRLDYDSSGLLLFSSDGDLTNRLLHPSFKVPKEYTALVVGSVNEDELRNELKKGVATSMGTFSANLVSTTPIPSSQVGPLVKGIQHDQPPEYDMERLEEKGLLSYKDATELTEVCLTIHDGKYRLVRRMLANVGYPVIALRREKVGDIALGNLEPGTHRDLSESELQWVYKLLAKK
eukprot:Nitzschia sp. Nitz4//scaffold193_size40683//36132//37067//NITZ4_007506-RA/size40683-processed-gene-0.15-mRNA-1//1//CDS//3329540300//5183//frame0